MISLAWGLVVNFHRKCNVNNSMKLLRKEGVMIIELLIVVTAICFITIPVSLSGINGICLASVFFGLGLLCLLISLYWVLRDYDDRL